MAYHNYNYNWNFEKKYVIVIETEIYANKYRWTIAGCIIAILFDTVEESTWLQTGLILA